VFFYFDNFLHFRDYGNKITLFFHRVGLLVFTSDIKLVDMTHIEGNVPPEDKLTIATDNDSVSD